MLGILALVESGDVKRWCRQQSRLEGSQGAATNLEAVLTRGGLVGVAQAAEGSLVLCTRVFLVGGWGCCGWERREEDASAPGGLGRGWLYEPIVRCPDQIMPQIMPQITLTMR